MKELPGEFINHNTPRKTGKYEGWIELTLQTNEGQKKYVIRTIVSKRYKKSPEIITQELYALHKETRTKEHNFPWDDIFVCGYGPQRASLADRSYYKYSTLDAVYTLFNYDALLQNPELILRRQPK